MEAEVITTGEAQFFRYNELVTGQYRCFEMEDKMRRYKTDEKEELLEAVCNKCGRKLKLENGYLKEGCFFVDYAFGYFSRKDGTRHSFDLCEDCYDEMVGQFTISETVTSETELL